MRDVGDLSKEVVRRNFHTLDAIRGVASIAIFALHGARFLKPVTVPHGYLSVDLFFVLSGCVIDHAYSSRLNRGMSFLDFMKVRIIRLYPLYLCGVLIGLALACLGLIVNPATDWTSATLAYATVMALLFLPLMGMRIEDPAYPLNQPSWSLFMELIANGVYHVLFRFLTVFNMTVAVSIFASALGLVLFYQGTMDIGHNLQGMPIGILRVGFGFTLGVLISRLRPRTMSVFFLEAPILVLIIIVALCAGPSSGTFATLWDGVCVFVVFPLVVYRATAAELPSALQSTVTVLGVTSYALYSIHVPMLGILTAVGKFLKTDISAMSPYAGLIFFFLVFAVARFLDRFFDRPIRTFLLNRGNQKLSGRAALES